MNSLRLPATLDSLPAFGAYVTEVCIAAGLDDKAVYRLRLAVDEIATNAIMHGYKDAQQAGYLLICAHVSRDKLTIVLEDMSPPYDPRETPPPADLDRPLESRPSGGFGVYLALQGVDAFSYEYADGVNRHTFMMNRTD
jgi:anti-sigma regulatory factor (Ser/Thr protein kinase)